MRRISLIVFALAVGASQTPAPAATRALSAPFSDAGTSFTCTENCSPNPPEAFTSGEVNIDFNVGIEGPDALCDATCLGHQSGWVASRVPVLRAVRSLEVTAVVDIIAALSEPQGAVLKSIGMQQPASGIRGTSWSEAYVTVSWPGCACTITGTKSILGWHGATSGRLSPTIKVLRSIPKTTVTVTAGVRAHATGETIVNGESRGDTGVVRMVVHADVRSITVK